MKAEKFQRRTSAPMCNYEDDDDYKMWYQNYFRNVIVSRGFNCSMSIKQIVEPANTYAVEWDHSFYTKTCNVDRLLQSLHLINVSQEIIDEIELETREQSNSKKWSTLRSVRLTASLFHSCCNKYMNPEGAKSLVKKIIEPVPFTSKATEHGKIHEQAAIDKLQEMFDYSLHVDCLSLLTVHTWVLLQTDYFSTIQL